MRVFNFVVLCMKVRAHFYLYTSMKGIKCSVFSSLRKATSAVSLNTKTVVFSASEELQLKHMHQTSISERVSCIGHLSLLYMQAGEHKHGSFCTQATHFLRFSVLHEAVSARQAALLQLSICGALLVIRACIQYTLAGWMH